MAARNESGRPREDDMAFDENDTAGDEDHLIAKEGRSHDGARRYEAPAARERPFNKYLVILSVMLGVVCLGLMAALYFATRSDGGIKSPIPTMPKKFVKFEQNPLYAGPSTQEIDQAWGSLTPDGDGFLIIDNPRTYNLPPGKQTSKGEVYDVSLFHQLHCLTNIRKHMILLTGALGSNNTEQIQKVLLDPEVPHMYHCLDYIRQALMCAGDLTIEWPREEEDGRRFAFDGWGITHECKSWDAIMKYMADNDIMGAF
ncbi:uncharacterized protein LTR77_010359 [Saxophila tyrrhenica]|uniref:Oxidase ustYa n=1 Tax=Saxophila tyrrhenica TaxID=1690608 RepID=A0AAV9NVW3_9PEZI|nr:hypothetical protein LTR77_010359 [Saxophila tyrrhenica]